MQYKVDDGGWTDWLLGTTDTSASFTGELGHVYHFHVRTWDNVGNERPYPTHPMPPPASKPPSPSTTTPTASAPVLSKVEGLPPAWAAPFDPLTCSGQALLGTSSGQATP
ncbi:MAG: hypothetical protein ACETWR_06445 [Anaerolineae bacterium]